MILPFPHFLIWVLEPHLRSHIENQSLPSFLHSETNRFDVQAKLAISGGVRKERTQSWTSSGKSAKETEQPNSSIVRLVSLIVDIFGLVFGLIFQVNLGIFWGKKLVGNTGSCCGGIGQGKEKCCVELNLGDSSTIGNHSSTCWVEFGIILRPVHLQGLWRYNCNLADYFIDTVLFCFVC